MKSKAKKLSIDDCYSILNYLQDKHDIDISENLNNLQKLSANYHYATDLQNISSRYFEKTKDIIPYSLIATLSTEEPIAFLPAALSVVFGGINFMTYIHNKKTQKALTEIANTEMDKVYSDYVVRNLDSDMSVEEFTEVYKNATGDEMSI